MSPFELRFQSRFAMLLLGLSLTGGSACLGDDWPQAAGPTGDFTVKGRGPEFFSVARDEGVRWRVPLPNTGQGAVIVSGDRVFVSSHLATEGDAELGSTIVGQCFDADTGEWLWSRELPGERLTDLSSVFSDNTAASPVARDGRVCFTNVGGSMACYDFDGELLWSNQWVPFGRHHARQHEPLLIGDQVVTVRVRPSDLDPAVTTKEGAKPLGRDRKYWTFLHAYDLATGELDWVAETGTGIHGTSMMGEISPGKSAILTGRGGGHQPPEEPYGISLVDAEDGGTIWDLQVKGYPSHQNACWKEGVAGLFLKNEHLTVDVGSGTVLDRVRLDQGVQVCRWEDGAYRLRRNQVLEGFDKKAITYHTNVMVGDYHYFRTHKGLYLGRIHLPSGRVEYLQVPVQVVRRPDQAEDLLWEKALPNDMRNADGHLATQDKRNAGSGWGHVSAAAPLVVGDLLYMPTMVGTVYVVRWNAEVLDGEALVSVSDLGAAGETWSLSSLSFAKGRIYARTLKELICLDPPLKP